MGSFPLLRVISPSRYSKRWCLSPVFSLLTHFLNSLWFTARYKWVERDKIWVVTWENLWWSAHPILVCFCQFCAAKQELTPVFRTVVLPHNNWSSHLFGIFLCLFLSQCPYGQSMAIIVHFCILVMPTHHYKLTIQYANPANAQWVLWRLEVAKSTIWNRVAVWWLLLVSSSRYLLAMTTCLSRYLLI